MGRITTLFTAALAALGPATLASASDSSVLDLIPSNFDSVVLSSGKPALVEFFAPWCGHCKKLAPIYEELAAAFASAGDKVSVAKVDADEHKSLGQRFGIQGFPTLKWFDGKSETPIDYSGGRDFESLAGWITEKTGVKPKVKKGVESKVEMLSDASFAASVGGDREALVAFTAPWCGHCKTLAPTWDKVAADFALEPNVLIAKVDCEAENAKATAREAGVSSYPTIHYYPAGSKTAIPYEGGRSEGDLVAFMNAKAGTHRTPGGGLDSIAGTVPSLDKLAADLKTGGDKAYVELQKAAGALGEKYAEYYAKVARKLGENTGYVEKESSRLASLLRKGGLAPEKVDDLIKRSNILARFKGDAGKDEL
ncbi:disulfide isomerase [Polychaeton citri CBS 116435]|uniref:protein disulfide-isomerase n=1 Tax=Polychaeton citri CBS 116435 TaxID=1314669 RepID=A0A9P4QF05_9PEZI|nr:disulfide isomerase [Polychaeton citri CBS 116435]